MSSIGFPYWDSTVTIYNKYVDPTTQKVTWYRCVAENCFWKDVNETYYVGTRGISTTGVKLETKEVVCRIPEDDRYFDRGAWNALDDKTDTFTLSQGDIIVLGEVEDVIDDYTSGQRSTDLITKYKALQSCLEVDTFVNNVRNGIGLRHYRVVGK